MGGSDPGRPGTVVPFGTRLVAALLPPEVRSEMIGDLLEGYASRVRQQGRARATRWWWGQVIRLRPVALRRALRRRSTTIHGSGEGRMGTTSDWTRDVRGALRSVRQRKGFSFTVIATVAVAIGATTSVFSVVNGVLLRPLDYPEPDRLVRAWQTRPAWMEHQNAQLRAFAMRFPLSVPTFNDWQEARTGLESIGIYTEEQWVHEADGRAEVLHGGVVTSGVFETLGVDAMVGRTLIGSDDEVGATPVAVLSYGLFRDAFGEDRSLVGRTLSLDGVPHVVVGVMPPRFTVPDADGQLWTSLPDEQKLSERDTQSYGALARMRPGATVESVHAELEAIQDRLSEAYPDAQGDNGARVSSVLDSLVGDVRSTLWFLLAAVGLVLSIACFNIANTLSVAGLARRRELAVKAALGASRARLVRGLLAESAVLAGLGGIGGMILALLTLPALIEVLPPNLPRVDAITVDPMVLGFGLLVTAATAVLVGILPALQAGGAQPKQMMDASGRGLAGGRAGRRLRSTLVVTEIALAFVLMAGATLLATSFSRLWSVERGFATEGLVAMTAVPNPVDHPDEASRALFRDELDRRLAALPGVQASHTNQVPLSGSTSSTSYYIERTEGEDDEVTLLISVVGDAYFDVMRIPLLEGRAFADSDGEDAPLVGVVNEASVARHWPGESPIGKTVRAGPTSPPTTIVGVAGDVRHQGLGEDVEPKLYVPSAQNHREPNNWVVRVQGDPAPVVELLRQAVTEVSPGTPVRNVQILEERIARSVAVPRFRTFFVVGLAAIATILALLGVYGVVTFAVSQSTRELAVRMAIGARARDVVGGTLASGLRLSAGGVALGFLIAWQTTSMVEEFLFEVEVTDPFAYGVTALVVGLVGVAASYLPARHAARVDPVTVLNTE